MEDDWLSQLQWHETQRRVCVMLLCSFVFHLTLHSKPLQHRLVLCLWASVYRCAGLAAWRSRWVKKKQQNKDGLFSYRASNEIYEKERLWTHLLIYWYPTMWWVSPGLILLHYSKTTKITCFLLIYLSHPKVFNISILSDNILINWKLIHLALEI